MRSPRVIYVETHAGWRAFFLCLLVAGILGCGFRLYFSPARLKAWVTTALDRQKASMAHPFALSFSDASLRLSDASGYLPQLAVVVSGVKIAPNPECHPEASVFIGELRLPFRVLALFAGRAAVGVIGARDITVDLDGLRARCDEAGVPAKSAEAKSSVAETAVKLSEPSSGGDVARAWWTPEQFETVRGFVEGFEFSHATLQFENKTKEIYLDSFSALLKSGGRVAIKTEIRIPPPVTYGETIPALKIEGDAESAKANLIVSARVSEGSLTTTAVMTPSANQTVAIDARMRVKNLPLSMFSPLMRKSGLADEHFQPKFLWLDCEASIAGPFQGLFQKSPLSLSACHIEGDGTSIVLDHATRSPSGVWEALDVKVVSLDLAKLFQTAGVHGPEGVASDFGRLSGDLHVASKNEASFKGTLKNARLHFSNRKVRAAQPIESADVVMTLTQDHVAAKVDHLALTNGELKGAATLDLNRALTEGSATLTITTLKLDPAVQAVLVGGTLGEIEGAMKAKIVESRIKDFEANLRVGPTSAADFAFDWMTAKAERASEEPPRISIESPMVKVKRTSALFKSVEPILLGRDVSGEDLRIDQPHLELLVLGGGEIEWTKSRATMERGRVSMTSAGQMNRDHLIDGWLKVDYPKIKNLKWTMKGPLNAPILKGASDELTQLKARAEVNEKVLGL